jgi:hypothetical protein
MSGCLNNTQFLVIGLLQPFYLGAVTASILSVMIKKILKFLWIIQEKEFSNPPYKKGYLKRRLNPFNPITYITILVTILIGFLMFGFAGFWKEVDLRNPFKWS